jgi:hypothetical protein
VQRAVRLHLGKRNLGLCGMGIGTLLIATTAWSQQLQSSDAIPPGNAAPPQAAPTAIPVPTPLSDPVGLDLTLWWERPLTLTPPSLLRDAPQQLPDVPLFARQTMWQPSDRLALSSWYEDTPGQPTQCFSAYCEKGVRTMELELFWQAAWLPVHAAGTTLAGGLAASVGAQTTNRDTTSFAFLGPKIEFLPDLRRDRRSTSTPKPVPPEVKLSTAAAGAVLVGRALSDLL